MLTRWLDEEIETLRNNFEQYGPAWWIVSRTIANRSPLECKRRFAKINLNPALSNSECELALQGYENINSSWYDFPLEDPGITPFKVLASNIKKFKFRKEKKKQGWTIDEELAIREGYETYGPNWKRIAKLIPHRTANQCKHFLTKKFIDYNKQQIV